MSPFELRADRHGTCGQDDDDEREAVEVEQRVRIALAFDQVVKERRERRVGVERETRSFGLLGTVQFDAELARELFDNVEFLIPKPGEVS